MPAPTGTSAIGLEEQTAARQVHRVRDEERRRGAELDLYRVRDPVVLAIGHRATEVSLEPSVGCRRRRGFVPPPLANGATAEIGQASVVVAARCGATDAPLRETAPPRRPGDAALEQLLEQAIEVVEVEVADLDRAAPCRARPRSIATGPPSERVRRSSRSRTARGSCPVAASGGRAGAFSGRALAPDERLGRAHRQRLADDLRGRTVSMSAAAVEAEQRAGVAHR